MTSFKLNDNAINFTLTDEREFRLNDGAINFKLNAITDPVVTGSFRLLEDSFYRLLESGFKRLLE